MRAWHVNLYGKEFVTKRDEVLHQPWIFFPVFLFPPLKFILRLSNNNSRIGTFVNIILNYTASQAFEMRKEFLKVNHEVTLHVGRNQALYHDSYMAPPKIYATKFQNKSASRRLIYFVLSWQRCVCVCVAMQAEIVESRKKCSRKK